MTFNVTNVGDDALQFGAVRIPLPFANDWKYCDAISTWKRCAVSDSALSHDAGRVIANRLTGGAPSLITTPVEESVCHK